jgi:hypothetical protein
VAATHEFYDYADEHFGWAETAKTERERAIFLQMAAAWLEVAQQWEAKGAGERFCTVPESLGPTVREPLDLRLLPRPSDPSSIERSLL